jgi:hypothetical protein
VAGDRHYGSSMLTRTATLTRITSLLTVALMGMTMAAAAPSARAEEPADAVVDPVDSAGVVDTSQGFWYLRDPKSGQTTSFFYGNPGDTPFMGDWDCDGVDTPGLYRRSDGYVYLRNSNTQGIADVSFYFGNPGDLPLAGDFDGDGCDTVSLFRPADGRFYVINALGDGDAGLGAADLDFVFGNASDVPIVGDWDGNGEDTFGMRRESDGSVYLSNTLSGGAAEITFAYGDPGDVVIAGSWNGLDGDTLGLFRPSNTTFYLRNALSTGPAGIDFVYGNEDFVPITGTFGDLPGGDAAPVHDVWVVSEYTTFHPANQARNININLIADLTDGAVVEPGEVFSLNQHVGQRTEEKGFVAAGAIIGGVVYCCDHPANIGGGTSQFATTLYNAIFFGAYDDVYHRPHSLYFSRYPVVREATLGWTGPDVQFRNDTAYPVTIDTSHTATSVTVRLIGNNEGRSVTTSTVGEVTPSEGGRATVYRWIRYANGTSSVESWTHTYREPIEPEPEEPPPPPSEPPPAPPGPDPL